MATSRVPTKSNTTAASTSRTTPSSSSSRSRPTPRSAEDELVNKMNKVLKVSDPIPQAGPSRKAPSATSTRKPAIPSASRRTASITIPSATSTRVATASTASVRTRVESTSTAAPITSQKVTPKSAGVPSSSSSLPKRPVHKASNAAPAGKPRDVALEAKLRSTLPWAQPELSTGERARGAMSAINTAIKALSKAVSAGYKHSNASTVTSLDGGTITPDEVEEWMTTCEIAADILRDADKKGGLGKKSFEVDKASSAVTVKAVALGMHHRALEQLAKGRTSLLGRYTQAGPSTLTLASSKAAVDATDIDIPQEWMDLLRCPLPSEPTTIDDPVKALLCQSLMCAWSAILAVSPSTMDFPVHFPSPSVQPAFYLHPLNLALDLPPSSTTAALSPLYRLFNSASTRERSHWLHTRKLSLLALPLTITISPPSKTTPDAYWEHSHKTLASFVGSVKFDKKHLQGVSEAIQAVIKWVELIVERRADKKEAWFGGKAWSGLLDFWIGLSRRLLDRDAIDRALTLMGGSSSLLPHTPPRSNMLPLSEDDLAAPTPSRTAKAKGKSKKAQSVDDITRICGDLAKTNVVVDKYLGGPDDISSAAAESTLKMVNLEDLSDAIIGLKEDDDVPATLIKVLRVIERIRRGCSTIMEKQKDPAPSCSLLTAAQHWLGCHVDFVEDLLHCPHDISEIATDVVGGGIDSTLVISRVSAASAQSTLTQLERGRKLCLLARSFTTDADRAEWLRCLSASSYNSAVKWWKSGKFADILILTKFSTEIGRECLEMIESKDRANARWKSFDEFMTKRFDLLAAATHKLGQRQASMDAYFGGFAHISLSVIEKLSCSLKVESSKHALEKVPDLAAMVQRCAQTIVFDREGAKGRTEELARMLDNLPMDVKGAILEKLLGGLTEASFRADVASIALSFGDAALSAYPVDCMPIRRLRVLVKILTIAAQSGERREELGRYVKLADEAIAVDYKAEYTASIMLQQALSAYYDPASSNQVVGHGRKAMALLRQILIPPTKEPEPKTPPRKVAGPTTRSAKKPVAIKTVSRPTRTPARAGARAVSDSKAIKGSPKVLGEKKKDDASEPIFEDIDRMYALLSSLAALFGVLGHVLAKVEALKLLRAILRREPLHVEEYVVKSAQLATEYLKLGKTTRAKTVFAQVIKSLGDGKRPISQHAHMELRLRYAAFLAMTNQVDDAEAEIVRVENMAKDTIAPKATTAWTKAVERIELLTRTSLANLAFAAIHMARGNPGDMLLRLGTSFRLQSRVADVACKVAAEGPAVVVEEEDKAKTEQDPFVVTTGTTGAEEPSKDAVQQQGAAQPEFFRLKHLYGLQWSAAESLLEVMFVYTTALVNRGSVKEGEHILKIASELSVVVKSPIMSSRIEARIAEVECRLRQYDKSLKSLGDAEQHLIDSAQEEAKGPDGIEIVRIKGDLFAKQEMAAEAGEMFDIAMSNVQGLELVFNANEALIPSPRKLRASINSALSSMANSRSTPSRKKAGKAREADAEGDGQEVVLPDSIKHVLRQQAWLLREAGFPEDSEEVLAQIKAFCASGTSEAEDLFLDGRMGLHEAFTHFKTDLWMSSLTESTLAMPMGQPQQRTRDRQSTRQSIQAVLQGAERSFVDALGSAPGIARVEDTRQACLSLALLRAFQTSLGEGSGDITASAADILASAPAITLLEELVDAVDRKYAGLDRDLIWPTLSKGSTDTSPSGKSSDDDDPPSPTPNADSTQQENMSSAPMSQIDKHLKSYWNALRLKYSSDLLPSSHDTSALPANWVVISINVTEDRTTMFISRHQANHEPLVFTLPLDRQGKREGEAEADLFTFDAAVKLLQGIIDESNEGARNAKHVIDKEGRIAWWEKRYELDKRLEELCQTMEFCWLGAFKTILSPETEMKPDHLEVFRNKIELVFNRAIYGGNGTAPDSKKAGKVHLDDTLLKRFAELSSKCKDEEAEDLVYFILDIYQFYGVQVALAELDIDQLAVDIKTVLSDLEILRGEVNPSPDEHLFLALDKNVSGFPWESIPILRGRAVSRIPSLPFLLDQLDLVSLLSPSGIDPDGAKIPFDGKSTVDTRKVYYILNPSGDLERTQTYFEPYLKSMTDTCGWKGIMGRAPTELEMIDALTNHDLVLYFGHGGAEQYIRSFKVRQLPKCATTMLWGCSSGALKEQGDFDRTGTAYHYLQGGCLSLVANLWDVTDRDIDRLSEDVLKRLHLDTAHVPHTNKLNASGSSKSAASGRTEEGGVAGLTAQIGRINLTEGISSVKAVALSRDECKLKYLTGAAPVVYGLPMYLH